MDCGYVCSSKLPLSQLQEEASHSGRDEQKEKQALQPPAFALKNPWTEQADGQEGHVQAKHPLSEYKDQQARPKGE